MSQNTKNALKEAHNSYKENNYTDAIAKCKKILKTDQNNYNALTLLAAAMLEIDEYKSKVPLILQKATQIEANNVLAWQGLASYYERYLDDNDSVNKLILIYCKILQSER